MARASVLGTLFLAPLVFYTGLLDAVGLPKIAVLWVGTLVGLAGVLISRANGGTRLPRLRLGGPALALLVVAALATAFSIAPLVSLRGMHSRYNGLTSLALCEAAALVIAALYGPRTARLRSLAFVLATSGALVSAYVFVQFFRLDPIDWTAGPGRAFVVAENAGHPAATLGNSNFAGGTLAVTLPFVASLAVVAGDRRRRLAWLSVATAQALAIWLTRSRGGLIGAVVGLAVLAIVHRRRLPVSKRHAVAGGVAVAGLAALAIAIFGTSFSHARWAEIFDSQTLVRRWGYWHGAASVVRSRPLLGTGPDTFYAAYGRHRPPADGAAHGLVSPPDKPHNVYLEYAADTGALGLAAYLALLGLAIAYAVRTLRRLAGLPRVLLGAFLAALAAYLAQAAFSIDAYPLPLLAWASLGAIAAFADPGSAGDGAMASPPSRAVRGAAGVTGIVLLAACALVAVPVMADHAAKAGQRAGQTGDLGAAEAHFTDAMHLDAGEANYPYLAGIAEENLARTTQGGERAAHVRVALARYRRADRLAPGHPFYLRAIARASTTLAQVDNRRFPDADRAYRRFIASDPNDWEPRLFRAEMLIAWADMGGGDAVRARARAELDRVSTMKPLEARGANRLARLYARLGDPYWSAIVKQMDALGVDKNDQPS